MPAKLYFMGHDLIENRHGLVVQADRRNCVTPHVAQKVKGSDIDGRRRWDELIATWIGTDALA